MKTDNMHPHCPEVENLMGGKMPFVTRCGITLVALVFLLIVVILLLSDGVPQQLMRGIAKHTIEQIKLKI